MLAKHDENRPAESADPPEVVGVRNVTRGTIVASRVIWAGTGALRRRGLLGRASLAPGEGMYLVPCQWVHTFGMRFPIDIAFLDARGRVLTMHHGLPPGRLSKLALRADGVLELGSGALRASLTSAGDFLDWLELPD